MNNKKLPPQVYARNIPACLLASIIIVCALLALEPELRLAEPLLVGSTTVITMALLLLTPDPAALVCHLSGGISADTERPAPESSRIHALRILVSFRTPRLCYTAPSTAAGSDFIQRLPLRDIRRQCRAVFLRTDTISP